MGFHIRAGLHDGIFSNNDMRSNDGACRDNGAVADHRAAIDDGAYSDRDILADPDPRMREPLAYDEMGTQDPLVSYDRIITDEHERQIKQNPGREDISP